MRLSAMWRADRTIDGSGASPVADAILERWPHDPGSARVFRSSANFLYVFRRDGERRFLRFADAGERDREAIEAETSLLRWLKAAGLDVVQPIPSANGRDVETVETEAGVFHAVVFAAMDGEQRELVDLDADGFRTWGAAFGRLHAALRGCPAHIVAARPALVDVVERARRYVPETAPEVRDEAERLGSALAALQVTPATFGLIHFDFELDNLVWRNGSVGMLDFDGCARGWYAADVAFALRDLFDAGAGLDDPAVRAFFDGYAAHRAIDDEFRFQVPLFSRVARFLTYASIARALDLPPAPDHPDWLTGLIGRLQRRMDAYAASLTT